MKVEDIPISGPMTGRDLQRFLKTLWLTDRQIAALFDVEPAFIERIIYGNRRVPRAIELMVDAWLMGEKPRPEAPEVRGQRRLQFKRQ
ncbi:hypothetical protein [Antarcticirhabdus aurantiaca]|uniref:Uncharacterized protein n=1 Tax=Antarcticirhabdus aurantiaca TaxID=2606717 RepID=A0ACD4NL23_9HYPH|nr:hypothetical protein OXU80_22170 [Jeongeuplla avenae]